MGSWFLTSGVLSLQRYDPYGVKLIIHSFLVNRDTANKNVLARIIPLCYWKRWKIPMINSKIGFSFSRLPWVYSRATQFSWTPSGSYLCNPKLQFMNQRPHSGRRMRSKISCVNRSRTSLSLSFRGHHRGHIFVTQSYNVWTNDPIGLENLL